MTMECQRENSSVQLSDKITRNQPMSDSTQPRYNAAGYGKLLGLYDPAFDHDSCGVGFIARTDAMPQHSLVIDAIRILVNLEHRGAVGGDKSTGDGAGLLLQLPDGFFRTIGLDFALPEPGDYAVAMTFLPTNAALAERCKEAFEETVENEGCEVLGWRSVPTSNRGLGRLALSTEPAVSQLFVGRGRWPWEAFERKLYVIRRLIEKEVGGWRDVDASQFYVPSFSCKTIVYKGLFTGSQIQPYYLDLSQEDFASCFSLVHQRYSTNTLPTWNLAQPFRYLAHNGEINTLRGNINRMRGREAIIRSALFGDDIEKIKPVLITTGSDSAILDNALELIVLAGRSLPHAMMMMVPEAYGPKIKMSEAKLAFFEYHSALMEPWDGPAALAYTDGRYIGATLDRNGLRPARYTVTTDGVIVMASETGVIDFSAEKLLKRDRLRPGKMFVVDLEQNRIVPDNEIKSKIARRRPYRRWIID